MAKTYDKVRYIETSGFNPHYNLAVESALMDAAKDGELIVYLWRNDNTVVIGRHQNAYLDVNIKNSTTQAVSLPGVRRAAARFSTTKVISISRS